MFTLSATRIELVLISPFWKSGTTICCLTTPILATCDLGAFSGSRSFMAR